MYKNKLIEWNLDAISFHARCTHCAAAVAATPTSRVVANSPLYLYFFKSNARSIK